MGHQCAFNFNRTDVFAPRDNDVLGAVSDLNIGIWVMHCDIARMEISALKRFGSGLWVFVIALHGAIAAHDDFALRGAVTGNLVARGIPNGHILHKGHGNTLSRLDRGAFIRAQIVPCTVPCTFGRGAIDLGQSVNLGHVEPHWFNLGQRRGGRGRTCGKDFDNMIKVALLICGGIDQHV